MPNVKSEPSKKILNHTDHYYTSRELSGLLNLSMSTLAEYRRHGTGPKYLAISYRKRRYSKVEVLKYLEEITRASTSATKNYGLNS